MFWCSSLRRTEAHPLVCFLLRIADPPTPLPMPYPMACHAPPAVTFLNETNPIKLRLPRCEPIVSVNNVFEVERALAPCVDKIRWVGGRAAK